jgi:hypothetical protein
MSLCAHCIPLQAVIKETVDLEAAELEALQAAEAEEPDSQQFFQLSQELNAQVNSGIVAGELPLSAGTRLLSGSLPSTVAVSYH